MKTDIVLDEIHEIRRQISEKCDNDPKKLIEYYMKRQEEMKRQGVKFITRTLTKPKRNV